MGRHAEWEVVNKKPGIILIQDLDRPGCLSITNDAEWVFIQCNQPHPENFRTRVVYRSSIPDDWTEIIMVSDRPGHWRVAFKPWYGEVWDNLTKEY